MLPGVLNWPDETSRPEQTNFARFAYTARGAPLDSGRFYRGAVLPGLHDWRSQIYFDNFFGGDRFRAWSGDMAYVKFVFPAADPTRVIYADSLKYLFHFNFITEGMEGFAGLDFDQMRQITRFNDGRRFYIGSVIFPSTVNTEYGIQFDSTDPLPPETVKLLFESVRSTVINGRETNAPPFRPFYVPSYEQLPVESFLTSVQDPVYTIADAFGWNLSAEYDQAAP